MKIKGILIDPIEKSITEVELPDSKLETIYEAMDCRCFDVIYLNSAQDVMYVDDNGLFEKTDYFAYENFPTPIAGKCLVLGTSSEGETISVQIESVESLETKITFIQPETALRMAIDHDARMEEWAAHGSYRIHLPIADIIQDRMYTEESE